MKKVLVTGAKGFVGKNLVSVLKRKNIPFFEFDVSNSDEDLSAGIDNAEMVIHLAGVNRPENAEDFEKGNYGFTKKVIDLIQEKNKNIPFILSSSIQAERDNPYGKSKLKAENAVIDYSKNAGADVCIYRFPNIFGKWCSPNYNSVVATFCYNISHDLPIRIDNEEYLLPLIYIDDVVNLIINRIMNGKERDKQQFYYSPEPVYEITLKNLSSMLYSFKSHVVENTLPDFSDDLTKKMFSTYLSYYELKDLEIRPDMHKDNRGWLFELIKSDITGQIFISETKPGVTRGNHYHDLKIEKFCLVKGKARIELRRIDREDVQEFIVSDEEISIVYIPPGYTHSITNISDNNMIVIFWANEIFDKNNSDTYYLGNDSEK